MQYSCGGSRNQFVEEAENWRVRKREKYCSFLEAMHGNAPLATRLDQHNQACNPGCTKQWGTLGHSFFFESSRLTNLSISTPNRVEKVKLFISWRQNLRGLISTSILRVRLLSATLRCMLQLLIASLWLISSRDVKFRIWKFPMRPGLKLANSLMFHL